MQREESDRDRSLSTKAREASKVAVAVALPLAFGRDKQFTVELKSLGSDQDERQ